MLKKHLVLDTCIDVFTKAANDRKCHGTVDKRSVPGWRGYVEKQIRGRGAVPPCFGDPIPRLADGSAGKMSEVSFFNAAHGSQYKFCYSNPRYRQMPQVFDSTTFNIPPPTHILQQGL